MYLWLRLLGASCEPTLAIHASIQNLESDMENLREPGYLLVFAALLGFALRSVYRGYKGGASPSSKTENTVSSAELPEPESRVEQIRRIVAGRDWLIKDALIAMLLFGFWVIFTASLGESSDNRLGLAYLLCGGHERCANDAVSNLQPAFEECALESCVAIGIAFALALFRWVKLVSLAGRVRSGTASILPEDRFRYRVTAKRIFVGVVVVQILMLAYTIYK